MLSAAWTVESRCAMSNVVRSSASRRRAPMTDASVRVSRALVASSQSRMGAFFSMALARLTRCFSPPDSFSPRSPTIVSSP
mmetsp:Transcript_8962/g.35121  ORF Transcript_8962/g.35121 Transcript_8962/m.35121 type:complete len:81 (-) Transcript_8962:542-784(-)